jgi:hypothetical protein
MATTKSHSNDLSLMPPTSVKSLPLSQYPISPIKPLKRFTDQPFIKKCNITFENISELDGIFNRLKQSKSKEDVLNILYSSRFQTKLIEMLNSIGNLSENDFKCIIDKSSTCAINELIDRDILNSINIFLTKYKTTFTNLHNQLHSYLNILTQQCGKDTTQIETMKEIINTLQSIINKCPLPEPCLQKQCPLSKEDNTLKYISIIAFIIATVIICIIIAFLLYQSSNQINPKLI